MEINKFGFSFFVIIAIIIATIPNNANSAPTISGERRERKGWPKNLHLDGSHWNNSCNLSWSDIKGRKMELVAALAKVQSIVHPLKSMFYSRHSTALDINNDTAQLSHRYEKLMPIFNKTLPAKKLLRDIHKSVQQYVGLFHALSSRFKSFDSLKQNTTNDISTELLYFLNESKLLLCEIETTLNVSHQSAQYLTVAEMKHKILKMTQHLEKVKLIELDAFYTKTFFYKYVVDLDAYLNAEITKLRETPARTPTKKSIKSKEHINKRNQNKNNRKSIESLNNSNASESSAQSSPKKHRKPTSEEKKRRLNKKPKLNNNNNKSNSSLNKKNKTEGSKVPKKHRHANKSTPLPAASKNH